MTATLDLTKDCSKNFAVRTIGDISQPIVPGEPGVRLIVPQDCSRIVIENGDQTNDITFKTLLTEGSKTIPKGLELDINAKTSGDPAFVAGEVVGWIVKGSGTGPVTITYTR
jgi:hypothetical protein